VLIADFADLMHTLCRHCRLGAKPPHFLIPKNDRPAPVLIVDPFVVKVDALMQSLKTTVEPDMVTEVRELLIGLANEAGIEYLHFAGAGSFVNTICCKREDGQLAALKIGKGSRPKDRIHNCEVIREAAIQLAADDAIRKHPFKDMLPAPLFLLDHGRSCAGTTRPNSRGRVLPFLFCKYIEKDFREMFNPHKVNWQGSGLMDDSLRRNFGQLYHYLFDAFQNGIGILDLKPDNVRYRAEGLPVFTDMGNCIEEALRATRRIVQLQQVARRGVFQGACCKPQGQGLAHCFCA
jgi:hypothetical protein